MLQQTQVSRVIPKYREFLRKFPNIRVLALSSRSDVLRAWSGLGYNRRAVSLHRAARHISEHHRGHIPETLPEFVMLPGIGKYSAQAVLAFAYDKPYAPVDTNIRRILIRHFGTRAEGDLQAFADLLVVSCSASAWSQMLMDFGALVCTAKNPHCTELGLRHITEYRLQRKQAPFINSDRYWRGRIVATLGSYRRSIPKKILLKELPNGLKKRRVDGLLRALQRDGVILLTKNSAIRLA